MFAELSPGLVVILAALPIGLLPRAIARFWMLAVPLLGALQLWSLGPDFVAEARFLGFEVVPVRIDGLSRVFGVIFLLAAVLGAVYALHLRERLQHVAAMVYAGAAIGAVFAGDLLTLFAYWELTAIASVFLIWARGTEAAYGAGLRYLVVQVSSGLLLLGGIVLQLAETGSLAFGHFDLATPAGLLVFLAFGIKCAFPLLHNWLQDAYPEATITGIVFLSAFTTKMAVYALARGFAGTEILIPIGVVMAIFPLFYAMIENDLRRALAYALNNQLGFMVVGIGIGTELSLNGTAAHAFAHIPYKALLFMSTGAVLLRTGTARASDLGGLFRAMPLTMLFYLIGAASIALPLFSSFVAKSMILSAAAETHRLSVWLALVAASAAIFHILAVKLPYRVFFDRDRGHRCEEAPRNMLVAMGLAALLCVGIGLWPAALYRLLPYPLAYEPYTLSHVLTQLQLVAFAVLAFAVLLRAGLYPRDLRATNLDSDWVYRRAGPWLVATVLGGTRRLWRRTRDSAMRRLTRFVAAIYRHHGPQGALARTWPTGSTVLWVTVLLGVSLLLYYV